MKDRRDNNSVERERERERERNAPTETGPFPQSHAQDLFVMRVRGNPLIPTYSGIPH